MPTSHPTLRRPLFVWGRPAYSFRDQRHGCQTLRNSTFESSTSTARTPRKRRQRASSGRCRNTMDHKDRGIFILRVGLGLGFAFAGLDKFLRFAGGAAFTSKGFLSFGTNGAWLGSDPKAVINPTHPFWVSIAGNSSCLLYTSPSPRDGLLSRMP